MDKDEFIKAITEAIVGAEKQMDQRREEEAKVEREQQRHMWEKAIMATRYSGANRLIKILDFISLPLRIILGIIFFRSRYATQSNVTFSLLRLCSELIFGIYQLCLLAAAVVCAISFFNYDNIVWAAFFPKWAYLSGGILFFIFAQIVRIAKFEARNTCEKDTVIAVFNAVVAFTAMVFSVLAVFIAVLTR